MNKAELIEKVAGEAGLTKTDAEKAVNAFTGVVTAALKAGDKVPLKGFGTFSVSQRAARQGINPSTRKPIQIPAKKVAKFKAGKELSDAIS